VWPVSQYRTESVQSAASGSNDMPFWFDWCACPLSREEGHGEERFRMIDAAMHVMEPVDLCPAAQSLGRMVLRVSHRREASEA